MSSELHFVERNCTYPRLTALSDCVKVWFYNVHEMHKQRRPIFSWTWTVYAN